jgi:hypothetical protein
VLSFLLFPVEHPQLFDAVVLRENGRVQDIQVKDANATSHWIWGAFKMPGSVLHELNALWLARERRDEYVGTLVNAWLAQGGEAHARRAGTSYVDVGTVRGYREAMALLNGDADVNTARCVAATTAAHRAANRETTTHGWTVPVIASPRLSE